MASEIRVNSLTNRSGLSTVSITDAGLNAVGIITAHNFKTGTTNVHSTGVTAADGVFTGNVSITGNLNVSGVLTYDDVTNIDSVGVVTARSGVSVPDGQKIQLGNSNDLQIYHTGSHSLIDESGTGNLTIRSSLISFEKYTNEQLARFTADGSCELFYDNSKKLETTNTGATITNDLVLNHASGDKAIRWATGGTNKWSLYHNNSAGALVAYDNANNAERLRITSGGNLQVKGGNLHLDSNAELALFEDNTSGSYTNSAKIAFDFSGNIARMRSSTNGSATIKPLAFYIANTPAILIGTDGKVGINETSPTAHLVVKQSGNTFTTQSQTVALFQRSSTAGHGAKIAIVAGTGGSSDINFGDTDDEDIGIIQYYHTDNSLRFTTNTSERLRIDSSGKTLIYGSLGAGNLPLSGNAASAGLQVRGTTKYQGIAFGQGASNATIGIDNVKLVYTANANPANLGGGNPVTHEWWSGSAGGGGPTKLMVLTAGGDLGVNTSSPLEKLHVNLLKSSGSSTAERTKQHAALRLSLDRTTGSMPYLGWGPALDFYSDNYDGATQRPNARIAGTVSNYSMGDEGGQLRFYTTPTDTATSESDFVEQMRIDANGYITKPNQPCAMAFNAQGQHMAGASVAQFNSTRFDVGNMYNSSNGRMTAPVQGRYLVAYSGLHDYNSQSSIGFDIRINGSNFNGGEGYQARNGTPLSNSQLSKTVILFLNANDYVDIYIRQSGTQVHQRYGSFSMTLLT